MFFFFFFNIFSNSPHESEMYEFLPATTAANDENMDVNEQSGLNTSISIPANQTLQRVKN